MKLVGMMLVAAVGILLSVPLAFAAGPTPAVPDYQQMTTDQLCAADPTFSTACSDQQRAAFEKEWNNRIGSMSQADRMKYLGMREAERARYLQRGGDKETGDYYRRDFVTESEAMKK